MLCLIVVVTFYRGCHEEQFYMKDLTIVLYWMLLMQPGTKHPARKKRSPINRSTQKLYLIVTVLN